MGANTKVDRLNWGLGWHGADPILKEDSTGVPGEAWAQGQPGGPPDQSG